MSSRDTSTVRFECSQDDCYMKTAPSSKVKERIPHPFCTMPTLSTWYAQPAKWRMRQQCTMEGNETCLKCNFWGRKRQKLTNSTDVGAAMRCMVKAIYLDPLCIVAKAFDWRGKV